MSVMGFPLLQDFLSEFVNSSSTLNSLPSTVLEATIPGYGIISKIVFRLTGIDIGLIVSGCLVIFGLSRGCRSLFNGFCAYFAMYYTSEITIDDGDPLSHHLIGWIAKQRMTKVSRSLIAVSQYVGYYRDDDDDADDMDVLDDLGIFNYEKWASNIPPRYEPDYGTDRFQFWGRTFTFTREKKENKGRWSGYDEVLRVRCTGRSTKPIKDLLVFVKRWALSNEASYTSVYRPSPGTDEELSRWKLQCCRTSRPIETVALDQDQKIKIIQDINEYLHPATSRWYATRGIPYRRGYLFHGSPGTGKTSLSFALAGLFGINIYVISLTEVGLTESQLNRLFGSLPKRCIVLLEDIDSAGLRRDEETASTESNKSSAASSDTGDDSSDETAKISKTIKASGQTKVKVVKSKSLISLGGLLNIIDGAGSHEGRVLIMSTNYPEKLDAALIRPGRVDLQIHFTLATNGQIRDIFTRMYTVQEKEKTKRTAVLKAATKVPAEHKHDTRKSVSDILKLLKDSKTAENPISAEELAELAARFADLFPEQTFSPAEIQGYLLKKKADPRGAVEEAVSWRDTVMEAKKTGKKAMST